MAQPVLKVTIAALVPLVRKVLGAMADPAALKPGELVRLVNSTPAGAVLTDRRLRAHRERAGLRIGDGRTVHLVRYVAWLAAERRAAARAAPGSVSRETTPGAYATKREREAARSRAQSRSVRDVGPLPAVADPDRKSRCRSDLRAFLEAYLPARFPLAWSDDHLAVIRDTERTVLRGGLFAEAMPRGSGKTSIADGATLWAVLYGHRRFVVPIAAAKDLAVELLESIKTELTTNDLLAADFPEACQPIRALEGRANRAKGQLCDGQPTYIGWRKDTIILPTVAGSPAAGGLIRVSGLTGALRGLKHTLANGQALRPDLVLLDDIQTDASARSPAQVQRRLRLISGAVLGLAGPGQRISGIALLTVVAPNDVADQLLSRELNPDWNGRRFKLLDALPTNLALWEQYWELRATSLRGGGDGAEATEFYRARRRELDAGARAAWPARYQPDEISAVQHAMNLYFRDRAAFFAEYQNEPQLEGQADSIDLRPQAVAEKLTGLPRGRVPLAATRLTAFVDVQHSLLYWMVCGWGDDFTGAVVDYGTWPDQQRAYFTLREARRTLAQLYPQRSMEAAVQQGLLDLAEHLCQRQWLREDDATQRVERLLVDWKDGSVTAEVAAVCRTSPQAALLLPSGGKGIGPKDRPMHQWTVREGERIGHHWVLTRNAKYAVRSVTIDTNYWKSFVRERLLAAAGNRGGLALFGAKGTDHRMLADHLTAETSTRLRDEKTNRVAEVWSLKPGRPDNHWFDCLVGCAVAASLQGCAATPGAAVARPPRRKYHITF